MQIVISGVLGQMGRVLADEAAREKVSVLAGVDVQQGSADFPVYTDFRSLPALREAVLVDFSHPSCLNALLTYAEANGLGTVLATTGYTQDQFVRIDKAAARIPVFLSANMSLGVALLRRLCCDAARALGDTFDVEIMEAHHRRKTDAPSGTARMLFEALQGCYDNPREARCGRSGTACRRGTREIGIHSVRGGTVAGEHTVSFLGDSERILLTHSAENRGVFASGALRAARFLQGRVPGLYGMEDLLDELLPGGAPRTEEAKDGTSAKG